MKNNKEDRQFAQDLGETLKEKQKQSEIRQVQEKILFTGLDNSGKTTIIKLLQREISQIAMLKPTRQAQRAIFNYLGKQISEWDLGGQERYRIAYLKEPTKYFDNTSVCIYMIDVQDKARIAESLSYFADVIKQFKSLNIEPFIYILFHKNDPDYVKEKGVHLKGFISEIKENVRKIVQEEFNVSFTETTIFDLWSIISVFSEILLQLYPQSELLDKTIKEFSGKINSNASIVLDSNSLVIGQHFADNVSKQILANSTPYFLTLSDTLEKQDEGVTEMIVERGENEFYIDQFNIEKTQDPLYILLMKQKGSGSFKREEVISFIKILKSIL